MRPDGCNGEIVIKEWRFLQGSGAEIYYRQGEQLTQLGNTTGGDDGYCPFADGKYSLSVEGDALRVRWSFRGETQQDTWKEATFSLPGNFKMP